MSHTPDHPPFPCDLDRLLEAGVAEGLSTLEVGAVLRLVRFAWRQDPPCTLPGEDSSLAMVARVTDEEWLRMRPRLLLALAVTQTAPPSAGGSTERWLLGHTRGVYDALATRARATSATKRAAGLAGAQARWQTDGTCMARAKQVPSPAIAAPSLRSQNLSTPAPMLPRSSPQSATLSARTERPEDVIAVVGERARALQTQTIEAWRRQQSLRLLQDAIARWRTAGLTTCPVTKASDLADGPHSEPARVEALIEEADALIAQEKSRGRGCNPVGFVISGLGLSEKRAGRPAVIPLFVADRWAKRQASVLRLSEAQAALNAKLAMAREATKPGEKGAGHA